MKKVITYGTFDLLHWGHINILKRAKAMGDYLIVAISTDEFNRLKHKQSYHNFENRKMILEAIRYVAEVIPANSWDQIYCCFVFVMVSFGGYRFDPSLYFG